MKPHSREIWVLKGVARARMLPDNLDHLRVGWRPRGIIRDCLGHAWARLSVYTSMEMEQHKPMTPSGMGLLVCGAGSHPSCHLGVQEGTCQRE